MSKLAKKDLHFPLNSVALNKLAGFLLRGVSEQLVAANLVAAPMLRLAPASQAGQFKSLYFLSGAPAAAGESMVVDVLVNGVSILSSTLTFDSTKAADTQYEFAITAGKEKYNAGDIVTVTRTYVAGGGPTMTATTVVGEPTPA